MNTTTPIPDIQEILELAQSNPDELDRLHKQWIEELIESAPEDKRQRLRGLQFQIDMECRKHDNPMGRCVAISKMMMESLSELNQALHGELPSKPDRETEKGEVINLFNKT